MQKCTTNNGETKERSTLMEWQPLSLPDSPAAIAGRPFVDYTSTDWSAYNRWAASSLRACAEQSDAMGRRDQAARERAAADRHQTWANK